MANLLRIEPTKSHVTGEPDGNGWFVFDNGRKYHRPLEREANHSRSSFPCPMIRRDSIDPCMGPDGQMHDSLSSYRRSLRPDGNPQGESYLELGNEKLPEITYEFDEKQRRDDIKAAIEDVKNGYRPDVAYLED
jgi:hypothetical protein